MLTRESLLENTLKTGEVKIESLGDTVLIRELSGGDLFHVASLSQEDEGAGTRYLVKQSLITTDGKPLFPKGEEVKTFFASKPTNVITEIVQACTDFSKLNVSVEDIEEEAKN